VQIFHCIVLYCIVVLGLSRTLAVGKVRSPLAVQVTADRLANGRRRVQVLIVAGSNDELVAVFARIRDHRTVRAALRLNDQCVL